MNNTISVAVFNGSTLTTFDSGVVVPIEKDVYIGVSLDGVAGTAIVYVVADGVAIISSTLNFGFVPSALNSNEKLFVGCSRLISTLLSPKGVVRFVKAYGSVLTANQHRYLQNEIATTLGIQLWSGSVTAPSSLAVDYDAVNPNAGTNNSSWTSLFDPTGKKNGFLEYGSNFITVRGSASISLKNRSQAPYLIRYTPVVGQTSIVVIATIGSASRYAEIQRGTDGTISVRSVDNGSSTVTTLGKTGPETQVVSISVSSSLMINHASCPVYSEAFAYSDNVFVGKAFAIGYVSPENAITILS
jgi:hypothetical protein